MKILVVGSGGREHALAWKLAQEADVICAPGNPGIADDVECVDIPTTDFPALSDLAKSRKIDLVVVGPEDPLINGLADHLRNEGLTVFGPGASGAALEGSKAFSKDLMKHAGVPTAAYETFTHPDAAKSFAKSLFDNKKGAVIKASGNALGKGVVVCATQNEADDAIDMMLVDKEFGDAGSVIVVEERLTGYEFSLLTLCSDNDILSLPVAQDHKRALDGDRGPNTGGMGTYSPVPSITKDLIAQTEDQIVRPALQFLKEEGIPFRGILFSGLMVQDGHAICLEYNVRFGDPETQSVMLRLGSGFAAALLACAKGEPIPEIEIKDNAAVSVVLASGGYPGAYQKGLPIDIPAMNGVKVFHAGTRRENDQLQTNGGRVLAVTAEARTLGEAKDRAYEAAASIKFEGAQYRKDIAASAL